MRSLVVLEVGEQGIEGAKIVEWALSVQVEDGRQGEAQQEVVGCAAGEAAWVEVGKLSEVDLVEEERIEPVHPAFVAVVVSHVSLSCGAQWSKETTYAFLR